MSSIIMFALIGAIIHPHWIYWVCFGIYALGVMSRAMNAVEISRDTTDEKENHNAEN